jgi:hypothetical protein
MNEMWSEVEESGPWLLLRYYPSVFCLRTMNSTYMFSQKNRVPGRHLNSGPPKNKSEITDNLTRSFVPLSVTEHVCLSVYSIELLGC